MTDATSAPAGSESASAPIAVITPASDAPESMSINQAGKALAELRWKREQPAESAEPATAEPESAQADAAPDDNQAPSGEPTDAEPAAKPPIEPPRSWTKEAKEQWQNLPPQTQEYLAQREQERDREVRRSQNEAAEKLKGLTAKEQETDRLRQTYEAKLPEVEKVIQQFLADTYADIKTMADVEKMALEDPFRKIQWDTHQQKIAGLMQEARDAEQRRVTDRQSKAVAYDREQSSILAEDFPEIADPVKSQALRTKVIDHMRNSLGYTDADLAELVSGEKPIGYSAKFQKAMINSMRLEEASKVKKALPTVPPVARPGTARPQGAAQSEALKTLESKLNNSGSLKAAQELRAAQVNAKRRAS